MDTQWKFAGMDGARVGLDYTAVEPLARVTGLRLDAAVFADLHFIEGEALVLLHERRTRASRP